MPGPGPLAAGERILLVDPKDRRYLLTLVAGATFHTHAGVLAHDDIIGLDEGSAVNGSTGRAFLVLRPTLSDVVLKMPRGAQVIYPKDLGPTFKKAVEVVKSGQPALVDVVTQPR